MSFILDALKKSESDRQRKSQPESAYIPTGGGNAKPTRWIWLVAALLLINVVVLLVFLLNTAPVQPVSTQVLPADPPAQNAAQATEDTQSFRDMVAEARDKQPAADSAATQEPVRQSSSPAPAQVPVQRPAQTQSRPANNGPSTRTVAYPTFNEARVNGQVDLPDLHLDIHVYSETKSERFVFVNMSKYKEGASLSEGPTVFEIVPEGAILEYAGTQFLLPRE